MVLPKRLDYGFNGYQVPPMPRATRSARGRRTYRKRAEDNQMCPFDLLATVAGKILLERESSPASTNASNEKDRSICIEQVGKNEDKAVKIEPCYQGSIDTRVLVSELAQQTEEPPLPQNDGHSGFASVVTTDCSECFVDEKLANGENKNEMGSFASKVDLGFSGYREVGDCKLDCGTKIIIKEELQKTGKVPNGAEAGISCLEDPGVWDGKHSALVSSDSSVKVHLCGDNIPLSSFPASREDVKIVSRDDDENSSGCTHPSIIRKSGRSVSRIGDRRIRKILASRYWKVSPKLKDETHSNVDGDFKSIWRNRKGCYRRQRSQMNIPFKKRKIFGRSSVSNSDQWITCEGKSDLLEKGINGDPSGSCMKTRGVSGTSSSVVGQHTSIQSRDSYVKLRIKSFRVPELLIEMPDTATVGSLKRTVMEAMTSILGGGLRVGVLLQGKKVRDDNKTLLQTGISHNYPLDALGFSLEPNPSQNPPSLCPRDSSSMLPCDTPQPLTSYPADSTVVLQGTCHASPEPHMVNLGNFIESDHDSAPSPVETSVDKSTTDSKALVSVPEMNVEALAVVPIHRKLKRSEMAQRRIRRPFSVTEVEALVQAVEKLGTGRWRDVKMRAFDNAKHRTYVDLKDKWKTLVHTARISPQQRRGEPVPQELLDRVLAAHAYWSKQQAKQQLKQPPETCLLSSEKY
ncbi:telomere repeat-binding protein 5-like [Corylus avellana]|uniref:telomere repeat-binding protein 5-like n=1 Tax=Corylus avellana TaxID=13451 RepID=UPI001E1F0ADB|nr:telomere repeat-binding protein 5-like [Corylus avellana]